MPGVLNPTETLVMNTIAVVYRINGGNNVPLDPVYKKLVSTLSRHRVSGYLSSLVRKGYLERTAGSEYCRDIEVTELGIEEFHLRE